MNNIRKSYETYLQHSKGRTIDEKIFVEICNKFFQYIMKNVLEGFEVVLPSRMGILSIIGREQEIKFDEDGNIKGLAPDWKATKKLWEEDPIAKKQRKKVYHLNEHSDNIRYRYFWSKKNILAKNKSMYSLTMTRANKRAIPKLVKEQGKQYKVKI